MFPHPPGAGGPGSFQVRFEKALLAAGHSISYHGKDTLIPDVIMVVGGTRKLAWLWGMKKKGVTIIYRLDGIGWLHKKKKVSLRYYLQAEFRNALSKTIHAFLAHKIVYQSQFVNEWWDRSGWRKRKNTSIIHNGVSIPEYSQIKSALQQRHTNRLVILEGVIDYTPYAVKLLNEIADNLPKTIQIEVYGKFEDKTAQTKLHSRIQYKGFLERSEVYGVLMGSVYVSLDIHPACPNTVAEALACGAPVVGFNTGAIPELIDDSCGKVVEYGSNPWNLEYPDVPALQKAIVQIFDAYEQYATQAYRKVSQEYSLQTMFDKYHQIISSCLASKNKQTNEL